MNEPTGKYLQIIHGVRLDFNTVRFDDCHIVTINGDVVSRVTTHVDDTIAMAGYDIISFRIEHTCVTPYRFPDWAATTASGEVASPRAQRPRPLIRVESETLRYTVLSDHLGGTRWRTHGVALVGFGKSSVEGAWYQSEMEITVVARGQSTWLVKARFQGLTIINVIHIPKGVVWICPDVSLRGGLMCRPIHHREQVVHFIES